MDLGNGTCTPAIRQQEDVYSPQTMQSQHSCGSFREEISRPKIIYCPFDKHCGMVFKDDGVSFKSTRNCPSCCMSFCLLCRDTSHEGAECNPLHLGQQPPLSHLATSDRPFSIIWRSTLSQALNKLISQGGPTLIPGVVNCPDCNIIFYDDGRDLVLRACPQCKNIFCVKCKVSTPMGDDFDQFEVIKQVNPYQIGEKKEPTVEECLNRMFHSSTVTLPSDLSRSSSSQGAMHDVGKDVGNDVCCEGSQSRIQCPFYGCSAKFVGDGGITRCPDCGNLLCIECASCQE